MEVLNPMQAEHLTKFDVEKCCQQYFMESLDENIKVIAYEKCNIGNDPSGFLGDHQFLNVLVEHSLPDGKVKHKIRFFLKCVPEAVVSHKEYIEEFGVFKKEVYVYTKLIPRLTSINVFMGSFSPKCYFAKHNMLVFENLSDQGFTMAAERSGILDYDHLLSVLKSLANFHSATLVLEKHLNKPINEIFGETLLTENAYPLDPEATRYQYVMKSIAAITQILQQIPKYKNSPVLNHIINEFPKQMKKVFEFVKYSTQFHNVICHGDLWANNIMFKYETNSKTSQSKVIDARLVDFQLARFAPPMLDVITVLTIPTTREFRQKYMQKLLDEYYNNLEKNLFQHELNLSDILSKEEFQKSYEYYRLFGLIESCLFSHLTILPKNITSNFLQNSDEFDEFVNNRRNELCLIAYNTDETYRERMTDMISELVDDYILN